MKFTYLLAGISMLFLAACSPMSKNAYLSQYENLVEEVSNNHDDYSKKEWEAKNEQIEKYLHEYYQEYKDELSTEEKVDIWTDATKMYIYEYKSEALKVMDKTYELEEEVMEEVVPELIKSGDEIVKEILPELEGMGNEVLDIAKELLNEVGGDTKNALGKLEKKLKKWRTEGKLDSLERILKDVNIKIETNKDK